MKNSEKHVHIQRLVDSIYLYLITRSIRTKSWLMYRTYSNVYTNLLHIG